MQILWLGGFVANNVIHIAIPATGEKAAEVTAACG